jgi:hypothetical protein
VFHGCTLTNTSSPEINESIVKCAVSVSLGESGRIRFPSVLLQPLGHLSVQSQRLASG